MDKFFFQGIYSAVFCAFYLCAIKAQDDGPVTPEQFFAIKGSTIGLPCIAGKPNSRLIWVVEHEGEPLRSRSSSFVDKDNPDLLIKEIKDVREEDAGLFTCSDGYAAGYLELNVIEPSHPLEITAQATAPDEVKLRWKAPANVPEAVRGYNIYVKEASGSGREATLEVKNVNPDGKEEFILEDLTPGTEYEIEVAALYAEGAGDMDGVHEGPGSPKVRIQTPEFEAPPPYKVQADPWKNSTIMVRWLPPRNVDSSDIDGYIVYYQAQNKKRSPRGEVVVVTPELGNQWQAILKGLKTRTKYNIQVAAFTGGRKRVLGQKSKAITIRHDGFNPELSIRAVPLGPQTVLVSVATVGGEKIQKLRLLYSDDQAIKWKRIKGYKPKQNFAIVSGLQARSRYFFIAKARVDKKARQTVTDVVTPPTGLSSPTNVSVTAKSDNSVLVSWEGIEKMPSLGYLIRVGRQQPDGQYSPYKEQYVLKDNEALVQDLPNDEKYKVDVVPFDIEGHGGCSDSVLFHLVSSELAVTTPEPEASAPHFVNEIPERMEVDPGDNVRLTCTALGNPSPYVQWFKDGAPIREPAVAIHELTLPDIQASTVLMCTASNTFGSVNQETIVDVSEGIEGPKRRPPYILGKPREDMTVTPGQTVSLRCFAEGQPAPTVGWYMGDQAVSDVTLGQAQVTLSDVQNPTVLTCRASNDLGFASKEVRIVMDQVPERTRPAIDPSLPQRIRVNYPGAVTVKCKAEGNPTPTVQWFQDGAPISHEVEGEVEVTLENIQKTAILVCRAKNLLGFESREYRVEVQQRNTKPFIDTSQPQVIATEAGEDVSVTCQARGFPTPTVQWFQNGRPISHEVEGVVEVVLRNIQESTILVCKARNRMGADSREYRIEVEPRAEQPEFQRRLPETITLDKGGSLRQLCSASGSPVPQIAWYRDGKKVSGRDINPGTSEYQERNIRRSFLLRCAAENRYGFVESDMEVLVEDPSLVAPRLVGQMPPRVTKYQGDQLQIPCAFAGNPTPMVQWYDGNTPMGSPVPYRSILTINSVERSTNLMCRGENEAGQQRANVQLIVRPREPVRPPAEMQTDYSVSLDSTPLSPTDIMVKWVVDKGDLRNIRMFQAEVSNDYGEVFMRERLNKDQRSITLKSLTPNQRYNLRLLTFTRRGVVHNTSTTIIPRAPESPPRDPTMYIYVVEIRDRTARVDYDIEGLDPRFLANLRLQVKDLDVADQYNTIFDQRLPANSPSITLEQLRPLRRYFILLDALSRRGAPILSASANFQTPDIGGNGDPVTSDSNTIEEPATSPPATLQTTLPPPTTMAPTTTTTAMQESTDTTESMESTTGSTTSMTTTTEMETSTVTATLLPTTTETMLPSTETTTAPTTSPATTTETTTTFVDHKHVMSLKETKITPYSVDLRWTIDRGPLEDVKGFVVTIKGSRGRVLLEQNIQQGNQRSITIQSLSPETKYFVSVKTKGENDEVLTESDLMVHTPPADQVPDTSNPVLDLEANEIRPHSAKLDWAVLRGPAGLAKSYKVRVLDGGPTGYTLLSQKITSDSLVLRSLNPNKRYHVIVDALDATDNIELTSSLTFQTPGPNNYGVPVKGSPTQSREAHSSRIDPFQLPAGPKDEPWLHMFIDPVGESSARLKWQLQNVPPGSVASYNVIVRSNGDDGQILLEEPIPFYTAYFTIDGLYKGSPYFIELQALSPSGDVVLSTFENYVPGQDNAGSSRSSYPSPIRQPSREPEPAPLDEQDKPILELDLTPAGPDQVKLNWRLLGEDRISPARSYAVKVHEGDHTGPTLLQTRIPYTVPYYIVTGLKPNTNYYIQVDALDYAGSVLQHVFSRYTPGLNLEPIRASSTDNNKPEQQQNKEQQAAEDEVSELTIVESQATGTGTVSLKWFDVNSPTGISDKNTMVRYAVFKDNTRERYQIRFVPAGQQSVTIAGLQPRTTYGFQVAAASTGGQVVRWSKLVLTTTKDY